MNRKIALIMALAIMATSALMGCTKPAAPDVSTPPTDSAVETAPESDTAPVEGPLTDVVIWRSADSSNNESDNQYFAVFAEAMKAEGINIILEPQVMESYNQAVLTASVAKTGFDIAFDWAGPTFVGKAQKGVWLDLTDKIPQEHQDQLSGMSTAFVDGKLYALPYTIDSQIMFYNKKMFADAGTTPEEFSAGFEGLSAASEKLKAIDVAPMDFANKEGYMNEWYYCMGIGSAFKDDADMQANFVKGHDFTDAKYVDILKNYKTAFDKGYFFDGQTLDWASNYGLAFQSGKAATMFGSMSFYAKNAESLGAENIGLIHWPALATGGKAFAHYGSLLYGAASFTPNPDAVVKTLIRITDTDMQNELIKIKGGNAANKNCDAIPQDNPLFGDKRALEAEASIEYAYNFLETEALDVVYKDMQLVITGEMTPEDWSAKMQQVTADAVAKKAA